MLVIDTAFFLLELVAGFLAHSLALTADAFHMVRRPVPGKHSIREPSHLLRHWADNDFL